MKKIRKRSTDRYNTQTLDEKLASYLAQSASKASGRKIARGSLAVLAPLAASALLPSLAQAQCGAYTALIYNSSTYQGCPVNYIDIDGDGFSEVTFVFISGFVVLFNSAPSALQVYGNTSGPFFHPGNVTGTVTPDPASAFPYNGSLYYPGAPGFANFTVPGSGHVPIVFNGRIGFIAITIDANGCVTVGDVGVHTDPDATSFVAGDCNSLSVPLAVQWEDFTIEPKAKSLQLHWKTATENNNRGFEIERSTDGLHFRNIGWVNGEGTSSKTTDYAFEDKSIKTNVEYYYRLRQIDFDGKSAHSRVVIGMVKGEAAIQFGEPFPNPAGAAPVQVEVVAKEEVALLYTLYDQLGKVVLQGNADLPAGLNTLQVPVQGLANGNYYLKLQVGALTEYKKVAIQK